jgi:hypothetical protein
LKSEGGAKPVTEMGDPFSKFGFKDHVKAVDVKDNKKELTKILEGIGEKFNSIGLPSSATIARKINKFRKSLPEEKYPASSDLATDTEVLSHEIVGAAKKILQDKIAQTGVVVDLESITNATQTSVRVAVRDIIKNQEKANKPLAKEILKLIKGKIYEERGIAEDVDFGEVKQKPKAPYIPYVPDMGDPDSLTPAIDYIRDNIGGISAKSKALNVGGEWDGAVTLGEMGERFKDIFGGGGRSVMPDDAAQALADRKPPLLPDGDTSLMWDLLRNERITQKNQRQENLEIKEKYGRINLWERDRSYVITPSDLKVGDTFKVMGEEHKVIKESEQALQIKKTEDMEEYWLPFEGFAGEIRIDKGSLVSPKKPAPKPVTKPATGELDLGVERKDTGVAYNELVALGLYDDISLALDKDKYDFVPTFYDNWITVLKDT